MKEQNQLSREEMRSIKGGMLAGCSAKCGDGSSVSCSGSDCTAVDNQGCTATTVSGNGDISYETFSCG